MPLSAVNPENYAALLEQKAQRVEALITPFKPPTAEIFPSSATAYRMRAEFRVWHDGDKLDYVMYRKGEPKTPVVIKHFPIASERIQALMSQVMALLRPNPELRTKLFQVEFLDTTANDTLVTLIYHRKLDDNWRLQAAQLAEQLDVQVIGRSRKQKLVLERDYVNEVLSIHGSQYRYRQYEQAFTQPNAAVNIKMIEWACECAGKLTGDLLELYCGNGNFTLPLSRYFDQVIATELAKTSIRAARENLKANNISNLEMIRLSAEEVTQAIRGERVFRRLADLPRALTDYDLRTIFVDPPRAGLDAQTEKMVGTFDSIIYISCNPETLAGNLEALAHSHIIERFAMFDQFPYTDHMECGVFLRKKN
ncbi:MAG: tRNA (uridine(54)-C5)-methyltransferase TrmA [Proteobacteria bacterium]|nr:tRNA (uridine(54)-C5)-methyltransferase TrmA [Pseudomonadota bacterium]